MKRYSRLSYFPQVYLLTILSKLEVNFPTTNFAKKETHPLIKTYKEQFLKKYNIIFFFKIQPKPLGFAWVDAAHLSPQYFLGILGICGMTRTTKNKTDKQGGFLIYVKIFNFPMMI